MKFEWDENKNKSNIEKHRLSFQEAQEAFFDERRLIIKDSSHSGQEERFFCIGNRGVGIATVRFTMRNDNIRIFGAGYWREGKEKYERRSNLH
jgi:uncharacterized DUF497 family protein